MSKKVINLKTIIDFFYTNEIENTEQTIHSANRLISEYNKNLKDKDFVSPCTKDNIKIWFGIKLYVKRKLSVDEMQIFEDKFDYELGYLNTTRKKHISLSNYYEKTKNFYFLAEKYMCYHHLLIIDKDAES